MFLKNSWIFLILFLIFSKTNSNMPSLKTIIQNFINFKKDGKIDIPLDIKRIKLDIGLSYGANNSQYWLTHEENLMVFGFEPNPECIGSILQDSEIKLRHESHGTPLEKKFVNKNFFLIPCALGLQSNSMMKFYVTKNDCGCSSIYPPVYFPVEDIIEVPMFSLSDFFDLFPFDTHPVIEYIKIDAQGSDLDIVKSAGNYLTERIIYITLEAEIGQYQNAVSSARDIHNYMKSIGFVEYRSSFTDDPTYFNPRFSGYIKNNPVKIFQR